MNHNEFIKQEVESTRDIAIGILKRDGEVTPMYRIYKADGTITNVSAPSSEVHDQVLPAIVDMAKPVAMIFLGSHENNPMENGKPTLIVTSISGNVLKSKKDDPESVVYTSTTFFEKTAAGSIAIGETKMTTRGINDNGTTEERELSSSLNFGTVH